MNRNFRNGTAAVSRDVQFLTQLTRVALNSGVDQVSSDTARRLVTESISSDLVRNAADDLRATLESVVLDMNVRSTDLGLAMVQESAAVTSALLAGDFATARRDYEMPSSANDLFVVSSEHVPNYLGHRSKALALEAFDNRENRNAVLFTMAYNYSLARQDAVGELVWPTLTLPADQVGFGIIVNRLTIHRGWQIGIDGARVDMGKIDLMRAEANPDVLRKNRTRVYPVARAANVAKLTPAADIPPYLFSNEGVDIQTAPYRPGVELNILGLSQTDASLQGGNFNQTDSLDPAVSLENLYVKIGDDIIQVNVYGRSGSNFNYAPQGMDKQRNLTFRSRTLAISPTTEQYNGGALVDLAVVGTSNLTVFMEINVGGQLSIESGNTEVFANRVSMYKVLDANGNVLPPTNADVISLETLFATAQIIGYDLRAYKSNLNMRERGDFIDRTFFTQLYEVPLLSPVTAQRPVNTDGQLDAGDFEALVTATRFRLKNDGITAILESCARLADWVATAPTPLDPEQLPYAMGAARFHVLPRFFAPAPFDVTQILDSLTSGDRVSDLQAAIVNIVRDYGFRLFVESEYPAAMSALGYSGPVTITIVTDPIIHQYLLITGDLRTGTELFNIKVESTIDKRFAGKLFMTFGIFDENRNQAPNILNWGNLIWAPEVVMSAAVPRGESMSRETIVQPRYLFVNHLPVGALLEFVNLPDVFKKLPIDVNNLP